MTSIFDSFDLHGISLNNRIVMAPMTRSRASLDNVPSDITATYYQQRATAGLIITEATAVSKQGAGYAKIPGIWNEEQVIAWKNITDAVHAKNGKIFIQVFHTGRVSHSTLIGEQPVSSGNQKPEGQVMGADFKMHDYEKPRALEESEIKEIVNQFKIAAENAKKAGFDGMEIHAANGYLIDQFLRDGVNNRSDSYGGSLKNRAKLLMEILEVSIKSFGENKVGVRFSPHSSFNSMSDSNPNEHYCEIAKLMNNLNLAYVHIVESVDASPNITSEIRKIYKGVMIVNEGLNKESATHLVEDHKSDLVCFGSPFISNPDLVRRLKENLPLTEANRNFFYTGHEKGYTDYPEALA